jgi:hypothetical protein
MGCPIRSRCMRPTERDWSASTMRMELLPSGSRFKQRSEASDHWHHTEDDPGKPYEFRDADTLLQDFFREVRRVLSERGISEAVVRVEERRK